MKEKIVTVTSEFIDYKGLTHKFIIAAVSQPIDARVNIYDEDGNIDDYADVQKVIKLGVAVCNPDDEFNEEKGKMIAINKARNSVDYAMFAVLPGMINTAVVNALVNQEVIFIKENPGRVIPGYIDEKIKFETRKAFAEKLASLTEEEKAFYDAIKNHKYPRVEKLLNA